MRNGRHPGLDALPSKCRSGSGNRSKRPRDPDRSLTRSPSDLARPSGPIRPPTYHLPIGVLVRVPVIPICHIGVANSVRADSLAVVTTWGE